MCRIAQFKARALVILFGILALSLAIEDPAQSQLKKTQLRFYFAFAAQTVVEGGQKLLPVGTKTVLTSGNLIKLFLQFDTEIYFFHLSSKGNLTLLSPVNNQSSRLTPDTQIYVPEGAMWLELDAATGVEKFFLIASPQDWINLKNFMRTTPG